MYAKTATKQFPIMKSKTLKYWNIEKFHSNLTKLLDIVIEEKKSQKNYPNHWPMIKILMATTNFISLREGVNFYHPIRYNFFGKLRYFRQDIAIIYGNKSQKASTAKMLEEDRSHSFLRIIIAEIALQFMFHKYWRTGQLYNFWERVRWDEYFKIRICSSAI